MSRTDLSEDGAVLVAALTAPGRGLAQAASRQRLLTALLAATLASLPVAMVTVPRIDFAKGAAVGRGPEAAALTPHQLEEAEAQAAKVGAIAGYAGAGFGPAFAMLGTGLACWLAFKVAGARPGFKASMAHKDFRLAQGLAARLAVPLFSLAPSLNLFSQVLARGWADRSHSIVGKLLEEINGVRIGKG